MSDVLKPLIGIAATRPLTRAEAVQARWDLPASKWQRVFKPIG